MADETRKALINKISNAGGHNGPNLGMVEVTVALHYVFNSPKDKIVFDVSHQCYPHKILTGRKEAFLDSNHFKDVTGYTNPNESEHDIFTIGHTSTSISLALGLAKGRDLNKKQENIIAVIRDGSLSGGEALEGLSYAESNREAWHAGGPFNIEDGSPKFETKDNDTTVFDSIKELLDTNPKAVVLNASTPMGLGMVKGVREEYVKRGQFVDVEIAEENMVAMSSGVAKNGGKVVFGTFAPFFQRTYDQISHDLCLNNSPATMLVLSPGVYGMNSNTHIALCDIQMFAHIPNLIYLAPASKEEYIQMFKFATTQEKHPIGIRVPGNMILTGIKDETDYSKYNKNKIEQKETKIAIFAVGVLVPMTMKVAQKVKEEIGLDITVVNPRFLTGLDEELLNELKKEHELVITIEDGEIMGGYGQNIASFYGDSDIKVKNYGISKAFHTDFEADKLLEENGISVDKLTKFIIKYINKREGR